MENLSYFKLKENLDNPLRVFFLCGSFFNEREKEKLDKRIIIRKYIESINPNYKCLILEENFMFSSSGNKLNYYDIDMKSLKSIEVLTSLMSDKVIVLHESISTATEIGLFSSEKLISEKMIVLTPEIFSSEEDLISGFMKLAYNNKHFSDNNLEIIRYFPGKYLFEISSEIIKPHFYFVNNVLGENLKSIINKSLDMGAKTINIEQSNKFNINNGEISKYSQIEEGILVTLTLEHLVILLTSLFTVDYIKTELRKPISNFDGDRLAKRKRVLHKTISILKKNFLEFIGRSILSENPLKSYEEVKVSVAYTDINLSQAISYFVYVMFGIGMVNINSENKKLIITNEFESTLTDYNKLIVEPNEGKLREVLHS